MAMDLILAPYHSRSQEEHGAEDTYHKHKPNKVTLPPIAELFASVLFPRVPPPKSQFDVWAPIAPLQVLPPRTVSTTSTCSPRSTPKLSPEPRDDPKDKEWMKYAVYHCTIKKKDKDESIKIYACCLQGSEGACTFRGQPQTAKRHINSVHFNLRPWECPYPMKGKVYTGKKCGQRFHQRNSLMIHTNGHTGEKPFKCSYCDEAFGDPARRNKHVAKAHPEVATKKRKKAPYAHLDVGGFVKKSA